MSEFSYNELLHGHISRNNEPSWSNGFSCPFVNVVEKKSKGNSGVVTKEFLDRQIDKMVVKCC
jgi:hypothetical protein